jgi:hypothetical protein
MQRAAAQTRETAGGGLSETLTARYEAGGRRWCVAALQRRVAVPHPAPLVPQRKSTVGVSMIATAPERASPVGLLRPFANSTGAHAPLVQVAPPQSRPHAPQLPGSVCVSTQLAPHSVLGATQVGAASGVSIGDESAVGTAASFAPGRTVVSSETQATKSTAKSVCVFIDDKASRVSLVRETFGHPERHGHSG